MSRSPEVRDAVDAGNWQVALDLLAADDDRPTDPEHLELLARAHYGNGDFEAAVAAFERLHTLLVGAGDDTGAAMAAAMIAMYLMMDTGLMAPVRGWLRRAERLLEGHDEAPADAMIAVVRCYERFMCGDMRAAGENAARGIEIGTRQGVDPAVVIGRVCAARVRIFHGEIERGLDLLDEIADDLMAGGADPLTTGMMYCELICAAQGMALHDRATEWTEVMERWRHGAAIGGISGRCRVHRAEILRVSGPCEAAEEEALGACEELRPWMRREFGWPLVELGSIRLRKGDLAGAEEAFIGAHERAWSPQPGLALLRLAQGEVESAAAMIADAIAHPFDVPSKERPPFGDLRLAPLLEAQAEIAAAAGDAETARQAAAELAGIASAYPSRWLTASAALAEARLALLDGDLDQAITAATAATTEYADIGAPFESAVARMVLGEARHRAGNADGASLEWQAARSAFEAFGAMLWTERAVGLLDGATASAAAPTHRPGAVAPNATFRCDGDTRSISFAGRHVLLRDLLGLRYIERMLAEPGREFHVLDLIAVEHGVLPTPLASATGEGLDAGAESGLPIIDDEAREAYRRRLAEVDDDIEEATRLNDLGRIELAERDRDYLIAELKQATGLGGRRRSTGGSAERARTSVTRSIRYALERLAEHHQPAAGHLGQTIKTGTYCVYTPDPLTPIEWDV